jgi:hypothetical protein
MILSTRLDLLDPILTQADPTAQPQGTERMGWGDQNSLAMPSTEIGQDDMNGIDGQHISERLQVLLALSTEVVSA